MSNCLGCGTALDPTQDEINQAVDDVLVASIKDAQNHGEICPLCGHSQAQPISHRKTVQFGLLLAILLIVTAVAIMRYHYRDTEREAAAQDVLKQVESSPDTQRLLGSPISIHGAITGEAKQDETGWHEVRLVLPIRGPKGEGTVQAVGGRDAGPWKFTTLIVAMPQLKKKADLIRGVVVEYDPAGYVETHTEAAGVPEYVPADVPAPHWDGSFPCVYATASATSAPQIGSCVTPVPMSKASRTPVDRFETDLRTGKFVMRQTDLAIQEAGVGGTGFDIPLTRTYTPQDWLPTNKAHAFGMDSNHPYDIAPLGTRNPYTEQYIVLEDGDFLYFPRVSAGSGYEDAIYRQSESGGSFYKATQRWNGHGWLTQLEDGSTIEFPESYNAVNLAQGAPTSMTDSAGNKITLARDAKRNLEEIQGGNGAAIKLAYDDHDRVVRAEDGQGHWTEYTYDGAGFLTAVENSDRKARYYFYEGGQLTFVRDETLRLLLRNWYSGAWLVAQQFGDGETIKYRYDLGGNGSYATRAHVILPDGSIRVVDTDNSVSEVYKRPR